MSANAKDVELLNKHHKESYYALFSDATNHHWYWDGDKWIAYTRQNMLENMQMVAELSKKEELSKTDPERAESFKFVSEWDMYEGVTTRSSLIKVLEDKLSLNI